jgi:alpha-ketoglutarate-dependent taurine dioxygenase
VIAQNPDGVRRGQDAGRAPRVELYSALCDKERRALPTSTQPQFVVRHHWQVGDLVVWDNTGLLHRALPYSRDSRRLMHRTTLVGDEEVA